MKKYAKKIVALVLAVILVATCFAGCAKINYITNGTIGAIKEVQNGTWNQKPEDGEAGDGTATTTIEEFKAGTYGGVEFKSVEDVANYYVKCFDYTKTLTAPYTVDGASDNLYKLLGEEKLELKSLLVEGKENSMLNNAAGGIVGSILKTGAKGLPPNWGNKPENDKIEGETEFTKSLFTADDIQACNVKDNGDGTITITIQPKAGKMSLHNGDSQGKFFNVLGDIAGTIAAIDILSFAQGDANDNVIVIYDGGTGSAIIDTASGEIVGGDYTMKVHVDVQHANALGVIKDKSATVDLDYTNHFPASDEYLAERKIVRG